MLFKIEKNIFLKMLLLFIIILLSIVLLLSLWENQIEDIEKGVDRITVNSNKVYTEIVENIDETIIKREKIYSIRNRYNQFFRSKDKIKLEKDIKFLERSKTRVVELKNYDFYKILERKKKRVELKLKQDETVLNLIKFNNRTLEEVRERKQSYLLRKNRMMRKELKEKVWLEGVNKILLELPKNIVWFYRDRNKIYNLWLDGEKKAISLIDEKVEIAGRIKFRIESKGYKKLESRVEEFFNLELQFLFDKERGNIDEVRENLKKELIRYKMSTTELEKRENLINSYLKLEKERLSLEKEIIKEDKVVMTLFEKAIIKNRESYMVLNKKRGSLVQSNREIKDNITIKNSDKKKSAYLLLVLLLIVLFLILIVLSRLLTKPYLKLMDVVGEDGESKTKKPIYDYLIMNFKNRAELLGEYIKKSKNKIEEVKRVKIELQSNINDLEKVDGKNKLESLMILIEKSEGEIKKMSENYKINRDEKEKLVEKIDEIEVGFEKYKESIKECLVKISKVESRYNDLIKEDSSKLEEKEQVKEELEKMEDLSKRLDTISEHSDILALNAAIEASKAGDVGKGFGIVAKEIRKLSAETMEVYNFLRESIKSLEGILILKNSIIEHEEDLGYREVVVELENLLKFRLVEREKESGNINLNEIEIDELREGLISLMEDFNVSGEVIKKIKINLEEMEDQLTDKG